MHIDDLKLLNFRNYSSLNLSFDKNINIFVGNNGEGKTNILEAIYLLSLTKSYRTILESDLIQFGSVSCCISGLVENDGLIKQLGVEIGNGKKKVSINNKEIKRIRDYISSLITVSFLPDDIQIIKGSPSIRRDLMNIHISQLDNEYISYLNDYNKVLKLRNEFLKKLNVNGNTNASYLDIINEKLIELSVVIYKYRFEFINNINTFIGKYFKKIVGIDGMEIKYINSLNITDFNEEEIKDKMLKKFNKNHFQEVSQGVTLIGPHRDDLKFMIDDKDMYLFSSQGQQRIAIIAFKLSEIDIFKKYKGTYPVLLLDDIFSEIDVKRRNKLIKFLKGDIQTIITTTDLNDISKDLLKNSSIFIVKNNNVTKKGRRKNGK
ncbi:MAG: DNA replication/repair protein RecF [archaeon]|nr:DNA replication/repair protein RecF [archaeon]